VLYVNLDVVILCVMTVWRILTKFCTNGSSPFCIYRLRGFGVVVGRMLGFSPSSLQRLVLPVILSLYATCTAVQDHLVNKSRNTFNLLASALFLTRRAWPRDWMGHSVTVTGMTTSRVCGTRSLWARVTWGHGRHQWRHSQQQQQQPVDAVDRSRSITERESAARGGASRDVTEDTTVTCRDRQRPDVAALQFIGPSHSPLDVNIGPIADTSNVLDLRMTWTALLETHL